MQQKEPFTKPGRRLYSLFHLLCTALLDVQCLPAWIWRAGQHRAWTRGNLSQTRGAWGWLGWGTAPHTGTVTAPGPSPAVQDQRAARGLGRINRRWKMEEQRTGWQGLGPVRQHMPASSCPAPQLQPGTCRSSLSFKRHPSPCRYRAAPDSAVTPAINGFTDIPFVLAIWSGCPRCPRGAAEDPGRLQADAAELGVNPRGAGVMPEKSSFGAPTKKRQESNWRDLSTALKPTSGLQSGQGWGQLEPVALPQVFQGKKGCPKQQAVLRPRLQWQSSAQGSWSLSPPSPMAPPGPAVARGRAGQGAMWL